MPEMQPFFGSGFQRRSGVLATAFACSEIQPLMETADAFCFDAEEPLFPEGWIPAYRGLGGTRVAPAGQSEGGPTFGLVSTRWDAQQLLAFLSWVVVLPPAHHGLDPGTKPWKGYTGSLPETARIQSTCGVQSRQCITVVMEAQQA